MSVKWDRQQRTIAKERRQALICLAVNRREAGSGEDSLLLDVVDEATAARVLGLMNDLIRSNPKKGPADGRLHR